MMSLNSMSFAKKVRWRVRILWGILVCMLAYMVVVAELGGGDTRIMTPLASGVSRMIFWGGMAFVIYRIYANKKLLGNRTLMRSEQLRVEDERRQYLHDKSGGAVVDILLVALLFTTLTAALFDMTAFGVAYALLTVTVLLKCGAYFAYSRGLLR